MENYYYKILGLSVDATEAEIETAFKKMLKAYHPDNGVKNDAMVRDILEAYHTLSDPDKRRAYDANQGASGAYSQDADNSTSNAVRPVGRADMRQTIERLRIAQEGSERVEKLLAEIQGNRPRLETETPPFRSTIGKFLMIAGGILLFLSMGSWTVYDADDALALMIAVVILFGPPLIVGWLLIKSASSEVTRIKERNRKKVSEYESWSVGKTEEIQQVKERYADSFAVLPERFQYPRAYRGVRELFEDGRADTMKEALNLYQTERYQNDMQAGMKNLQTQVAAMYDQLANMNIKVDVTVW